MKELLSSMTILQSLALLLNTITATVCPACVQGRGGGGVSHWVRGIHGNKAHPFPQCRQLAHTSCNSPGVAIVIVYAITAEFAGAPTTRSSIPVVTALNLLLLMEEELSSDLCVVCVCVVCVRVVCVCVREI